jgi:small subunit ribosomal protein S19
MGKRSLWKGPFLSSKIVSDIKLNNSLKILKTTSRNTTILPFLIGKTIHLHNGKFFVNCIISEDLLGHTLGEFVPTRLRQIYKKKK